MPVVSLKHCQLESEPLIFILSFMSVILLPAAYLRSCRAIIHIYLFSSSGFVPVRQLQGSLCLSPLPEEPRKTLPSILRDTCAVCTKSRCSISHIPGGSSG